MVGTTKGRFALAALFLASGPSSRVGAGSSSAAATAESKSSMLRALGNNNGVGKGNGGSSPAAAKNDDGAGVECTVERIIAAPKDPERFPHSDKLYCVSEDDDGKVKTLEIEGLDSKSEGEIRAALDDGRAHKFKFYGAARKGRGRSEVDMLEVPEAEDRKGGGGGGEGKRKGQIEEVSSSARYEKGTGAKARRLSSPLGDEKRSKDRNNRRELVVRRQGVSTVLVLRAESADCAPIGSSSSEVRDKVFGGPDDPDGINLSTQTDRCSHSKMQFVKPADEPDHPAMTGGLIDVYVNASFTGMASGNAVDATYNAVKGSMGGNLDRFDHVMYLLPGCVDFASAAAWAYYPGQTSAYDGGYGLMTWVQMHEIGHNIHLMHSGKDGAGYADSSGYMGAGALGAEPEMCFNAAKSWYLEWYSEYHAEFDPATSSSWSGTLSGLTDWSEATESDTIVLRIETYESQKLYLTYNRREGINADTQRFGDTVTVVRGDKGAQSWNEAALSPGERYQTDIVSGSGMRIEVIACEHVPGSPDRARISVVMLGDGGPEHSCEYVPPPRWPSWPAHAGALSEGMVGYYTFDGTYDDTSAKGHHGSQGGASSPSFVSEGDSVVGSGALSLDGVDDYVSLPKHPDLDFGAGDFTLTFWYRTSADQSSDPVVIGNKDWNSGSNTGWLISANFGSGSNGDDLHANVAVSGSGRVDTASIDVAFGTWHFAFLRVDRSAGDLTLCRSSGTSLDCRTNDISSVVGSLDTAYGINIGQDGTGTYRDSTIMDMDDLGIWRRALSEDEIMDIFDRAYQHKLGVLDFDVPPPPTPAPPPVVPDPLALYEMENDLDDSTGNGYHGAVASGGTTPTFGSGSPGDEEGSYLALSNQQSVSLGSPSDFAFTGSTGFSVSLWVKTTPEGFYTGGSDPALISNKDWYSGSNKGWVIAAGGNGRWQWNYADGSGARCDYDGPGGQLNDGEWHHIVASHSFGAGEARLFFDGMLVTTKTCIEGMGSIATGLSTTVGTDPSSYNAWFNGDVDKVAIYDEPLSHAVVFGAYRAGRGRTNPEPTRAPTGSMRPTDNPTSSPTQSPTSSPTSIPTSSPTQSPTDAPTTSPTDAPTSSPTGAPTSGPTSSPSLSPTDSPTVSPTDDPTSSPTASPTSGPTTSPTDKPTLAPVAATAQCLGSDPQTCGCSQVKQADYRGTLAVTVNSRTCQRWDDHSYHSHYHNTAESRPDSDLIENYCRNPDGEPGVWCYTTDPNVRWERCDVPFCPVVCQSDPQTCGCDSVRQKDYRGDIAVTVSGRTCLDWTVHTPHQHYNNDPDSRPDADLRENYCRNPDNEPGGAWCYTTDPDKRWEYCDVPSCNEG